MGTDKKSHYFPFSSDFELYLRSLRTLLSTCKKLIKFIKNGECHKKSFAKIHTTLSMYFLMDKQSVLFIRESFDNYVYGPLLVLISNALQGNRHTSNQSNYLHDLQPLYIPFPQQPLTNPPGTCAAQYILGMLYVVLTLKDRLWKNPP